MMIKAYILIEAAIGKVAGVVAALGELPEVVSADPVAGPYDVIAVVQAEKAEYIGRMVMEKIHSIDGVNYTMTCVAVSG
jgi:DNA-binding Lrp family transcriptional regulator